MKLALFLFIGSLASAANLSNVVISGQSPAPFVNNFFLYRTYADFRPISNSGVFTDIDGGQLYTSHYGAIAAVQTGIDGPDVTLTVPFSYQLGFTVLDPQNNGYSLTLGHTIVGFLDVGFDVDNSVSRSSVGARYQGITVEWLGPNNNWIPISALELTTNAAIRADEDDPLVSRFLLDGSSATAFVLTGTRDFQFRFNFDLSVGAGPGAAGEAAIRLGLDPCTALPSLSLSCTPGADGFSLEQLGHFATVRLDSFSGPIQNEVPEPATLFTSAAALLLAIHWSRRR